MKLLKLALAFLLLAAPSFAQADPCAPKDTPVVYPNAPDCAEHYNRSSLDEALCRDLFDAEVDAARTLACNAWTAADAAYNVAKNLADANYAAYVLNVNRYIQIREAYGQAKLLSGEWTLAQYDAYMAPFYLVWDTIHAQAQAAWDLEMAGPTQIRDTAKTLATSILNASIVAATSNYLTCMELACKWDPYESVQVPDEFASVGGVMLPSVGLLSPTPQKEVALSILPSYVSIIL